MRQYGTTGVTLKDSVRALKDSATGLYIALADENKPPRLAELHLATLAPADRPECVEHLVKLANRRIGAGAYELERVDRL